MLSFFVNNKFPKVMTASIYPTTSVLLNYSVRNKTHLLLHNKMLACGSVCVTAELIIFLNVMEVMLCYIY